MYVGLEFQLLTTKMAGTCVGSLNRGKAVATGMGLFAAIIRDDEILLRNGREQAPLLYEQDWSGKWKLPGGGINIVDLAPKNDYTGTFLTTLKREIAEETGLLLDGLEESLCFHPALFADEENGQVDLVLVTLIGYERFAETAGFYEKVRAEKIRFFPLEVFSTGEFPIPTTAPMQFLIRSVIKARRK